MALVIAAAVVSASILGVFAWLKGRRVVPIAAWSGSLAALLLLLLSSASVAENYQGLTNWVDANSDLLATVVGIFLGIGLVGSLLAVFRLAKPSSHWAQNRYVGDKYDAAVQRHGPSRIKAR